MLVQATKPKCPHVDALHLPLLENLRTKLRGQIRTGFMWTTVYNMCGWKPEQPERRLTNSQADELTDLTVIAGLLRLQTADWTFKDLWASCVYVFSNELRDYRMEEFPERECPMTTLEDQPRQARDFLRMLSRVVDSLPERDRLLVFGKGFGLSVAEIERLTGVDQTTVNRRLKALEATVRYAIRTN